jgi:hypothetical protein
MWREFLNWYLQNFTLRMKEFQIEYFQMVSNFQLKCENFNWFLLQNPLEKLRGEFQSGETGKAFQKGGGISNSINAFYNHISKPLTICKSIWIEFQRICKNKTCGTNVVQNIM